MLVLEHDIEINQVSNILYFIYLRVSTSHVALIEYLLIIAALGDLALDRDSEAPGDHHHPHQPHSY